MRTVIPSSRRVVQALAFLWVVLSGCEGEAPPLVVVDLVTDLRPGEEFVSVRTELTGRMAAGPVEAPAMAGTPDDYGLGVRVAEFTGLARGAYQVRVALMARDGVELLARTVAFRVVKRRIVRVVVTRSCLEVRCPTVADEPSATECVGGRCVPPTCGGDDEAACGEAECTTDVQCAPFEGSCLGRCEQGVCLEAPRQEACAPGQQCGGEGRCLEVGPRPDASTDASTDAAPEGGASDGGAEAGLGDAGPDGGDAGDPCPGGCDDGNPCTADRCTSEGCVFESGPMDGAACDDGVYCNGPDQCAAGSCSVHAGDPCEGGTSCDEEADTCVGCRDDADCPGPMVGPWGACSVSGSSGDAFCAGTRTRTRTTYRCDPGSRQCVGSSSEESEPCSTNEGRSCRSRSLGGWSPCSGFSNTCDETGTQQRAVTDYVCSAGSCSPSTSTETRACTRDTDGTSCGSTSCGAWGSCGGFSSTCDETGSQERTCTDYVCSAGSCGSSTRTETRACTRDTDGTSCGSTSCGAWGSCGGFSSTCDETGSQGRTCTDYVCSAGSCGSSTRTETRACTRDTDGTRCQGDSCGAWSTCGGFTGECDSTGTQSRTCYSYACSAGSCAVSSSRTETQSCTRLTEGRSCRLAGGGTGCCAPPPSEACLDMCL